MNIALPDGSVKELAAGATVADVAASIGAGLAKAALAGKVDGTLVDLTATVTDGATVEIITAKSPEALHIMRHSCAHIMAEAVQELYPGTQIAFGPATDDGYFYDFELPNNISSDDFGAIEKKMAEIVKADEPFVREVVSIDEAKKIFADQRFKLEHIDDLTDQEISIYRHGSFVDLCAGPHVPSAGKIGAFKMMKLAGAYWRGDATREQLQRLYGTAFFKKSELEEYLHNLEEAEKRDHRRIGREMDIFMMRDEAPGFPFFLPNGMILKNTLLDYWREIHKKAGYVEISTPMIMNKQLWQTSGHWDHYKDNMYSTVIDEEEYCVKPMNCPGGVLVYASKPHSYRDLPIRAGEIGLVHRHEMKGALHGLFRVRCFNQDDAHLFVRPDQLTEEIVGVVKLIDSVYQQFGFTYHVELSTRPEDSMGSDEDWEAAEAGLKTALEELGMEYEVNEGDGAFYGPKIDFHLTDSLGRTWQCGTVQLDFQMPQNFDLEYTDADGSKKRPVMLHRVCYGSVERFIGILIEHYAGKFPVWLAPMQVKVLPVSEKSRDYAHKVADAIEAAGIRVVVDNRDEKIGYKIREARSIDRVPYMVIVGEKEAEEGTISVRDRTNETHPSTIEDFCAKVREEIRTRA
ncbi:MAG: threonine--tRNA ligase [Ellagibacter isourolithinifaciens]|jgi:threonyl-tRNA synthetase|uniref:threonine--tRNA ligase n=1 Tax=Ellagibacter isourolithinifaciens TaxID=2137581 RepID=UPI000D79AE66|nr:threonine--tRNA ligase [Ellagibacter isourolithinifaciens]MDO5801597.1 threonine--tRNA ligase [Coriobacteriia bacterium]MDD7689392.1 threonine--tRNA ligase [Ellagibacter isourolithinifaciens]MDY4122742.1 threonine--tRNA ligase [Ellagibacter isourolithinifaciens]MDY4988055.1 threonine--tRNA ligase [Ellagibacter isourolithinifaciens]MEE1454462.1 threonine--tRNA ligase [Ellagibacter isourolithinifaciens]